MLTHLNPDRKNQRPTLQGRGSPPTEAWNTESDECSWIGRRRTVDLAPQVRSSTFLKEIASETHSTYKINLLPYSFRGLNVAAVRLVREERRLGRKRPGGDVRTVPRVPAINPATAPPR